MMPTHRLDRHRSLVCCQPRALLAAILSFSCVQYVGIDLPAIAAIPAAASKDKKPKPDPSLKGLPITELTPDEAILHALNRLAYGPRPGDVERIRQMGLPKWIDLQLSPNSIDDRAVNARLENLPTLAMSTTRLIEDYPQPKQAAKLEAKREQAAARANQKSPESSSTEPGKEMKDPADANAPAETSTATFSRSTSGEACNPMETPQSM